MLRIGFSCPLLLIASRMTMRLNTSDVLLKSWHFYDHAFVAFVGLNIAIGFSYFHCESGALVCFFLFFLVQCCEHSK